MLRQRILEATLALERYRRAASPESPSRGPREYFNVEGAMKEAMDRAMDRATERRMGDAKDEALEQACIALLLLTIYTGGLLIGLLASSEVNGDRLFA